MFTQEQIDQLQKLFEKNNIKLEEKILASERRITKAISREVADLAALITHSDAVLENHRVRIENLEDEVGIVSSKL